MSSIKKFEDFTNEGFQSNVFFKIEGLGECSVEFLKVLLKEHSDEIKKIATEHKLDVDEIMNDLVYCLKNHTKKYSGRIPEPEDEEE